MQYLVWAFYVDSLCKALCAVCFFAYSSLQGVIPFPTLVCRRSLQGLNYIRKKPKHQHQHLCQCQNLATHLLFYWRAHSFASLMWKLPWMSSKLGKNPAQVLHPTSMIGMTFFLNIWIQSLTGDSTEFWRQIFSISFCEFINNIYHDCLAQ